MFLHKSSFVVGTAINKAPLKYQFAEKNWEKTYQQNTRVHQRLVKDVEAVDSNTSVVSLETYLLCNLHISFHFISFPWISINNSPCWVYTFTYLPDTGSHWEQKNRKKEIDNYCVNIANLRLCKTFWDKALLMLHALTTRRRKLKYSKCTFIYIVSLSFSIS